MDKKVYRLLLVEDDVDLSVITGMQLRNNGYEVEAVRDGQTALETLQRMKIDLILLDVMLPDCDGHDLCEQIRAYFSGPVIFMSCLGDSANIVDAFRQGGNDYLVKPVDPDELTERVRKNLEDGSRKRENVSRHWFRQFMVDEKTRSVYRVRDGKLEEKLELSPTEYQILLALVKRPDEVHLYRELYQAVWQQDDLDDMRTMMVHVSNLRKKIDYLRTDPVRTVRGAGYIFSDV